MHNVAIRVPPSRDLKNAATASQPAGGSPRDVAQGCTGVCPPLASESCMAVIADPRPPAVLHPLHAVFLAGAFWLFAGALSSDIAYARSYEIQWNNFASWLIAGGLVLGAVGLVFALAGVVRNRARGPGPMAYLLVLAAAWIVQFFNALMHARDAWASMPGGLVLSVIGTLLFAAAVCIGFHAPRTGVRT